MPNLNRVMLMGNLTRDPELRYLPNNTAVVNFGMAMNRRWRGQEGEQRDETTFVDCSAFARTAEVINQYLKKGRPVFIEGRLKYEQWQDRESGANRSRLSVVVENFQFIDSRGGDSADEGGQYQAAGAASTPANSPASTPADTRPVGGPAPEAEPHKAVDEADIPF